MTQTCYYGLLIYNSETLYLNTTYSAQQVLHGIRPKSQNDNCCSTRPHKGKNWSSSPPDQFLKLKMKNYSSIAFWVRISNTWPSKLLWDLLKTIRRRPNSSEFIHFVVFWPLTSSAVQFILHLRCDGHDFWAFGCYHQLILHTIHLLWKNARTAWPICSLRKGWSPNLIFMRPNLNSECYSVTHPQIHDVITICHKTVCARSKLCDPNATLNQVIYLAT